MTLKLLLYILQAQNKSHPVEQLLKMVGREERTQFIWTRVMEVRVPKNARIP
jgi:hypothetical protein